MRSLIRLVDRILVRYTPDPFVIAIFLAWLTVVLAVWLTDSSFTETVDAWGDGFWSLAGFTLKMVMILLGGFVLATSPPAERLLKWMAARVQTPVQGVLFCTLTAIGAAWISWGLGLVVGGLVALEMGRRLPQVPFRIFVASSYSGFLVWHGGLSGSIPLTVNTAGDPSLEWLGGATIPTSVTLFGPVNLTALIAVSLLLGTLAVVFLKVVPDTGGETASLAGPLPATGEVPEMEEDDAGPASRLERSFWVAGVLVALMAIYLYNSVASASFRLNLDSLTMILFMCGLLLQGSPQNFVRSMTEATPKIAPILIQYPLYAAIMGVLSATGLAALISEWFVSVSSKETFPLMTFFSAGLINLLVPSGGGQWQVQAPIVLPAAQTLGADIPKTVMAVAWGDAWTNMAQPFWAVPLLAIAGLRIRDIIGLCLVILLASGLLLGTIFLLL